MEGKWSLLKVFQTFPIMWCNNNNNILRTESGEDLQLGWVDSLLSEDSQYKISLFPGIEAGRNDQIISRRQFEPARHFPQVAEKH